MNYKNRGMFLESLINKTIILYSRNDVALFHKKNIPITFGKIQKEGFKLKLENGRILNKSTIDYYGIYKSIFIAFEAKSTKLNSLPLSNIKIHQQQYLKKIDFYGGIAFYIVFYSKFDQFFLIPWYEIEAIESKSLNIEIAKKIGYSIELIYPGILDFVPILDKLK